MIIRLIPIKETEKEKFIKDLQSAFEVAVIKEYGKQDEEANPRKDIEDSINAKGVETFNISLNNEIVGGVVIAINEKTLHNSLELFFIKENYQSKGIGLSVWKAVEKKYPNTKVWETVTPYFEKRNIHFYVNRCGFKIVEFFNPYHKDDNIDNMQENNTIGQDYFFRFEKEMK